MLARAIAFLIIFLFLFAAMVASFNRKPPEGQYLIDAKADANPGAWPATAIVCNPVVVPNAVERPKKEQRV